MTQTPGKDPEINGATPQASEVKAQFQVMLAPSSEAMSRKAWGIDVSSVWLPYFTAAKTVGAVDDVDLPDASLGAPFRLRRDKDPNEVRFSQSGRPMFFVAAVIGFLGYRPWESLAATETYESDCKLKGIPKFSRSWAIEGLSAGGFWCR